MSVTFTHAQLKRLAEGAGPNAPIHDLVKATAPKRKGRTPARELPPSQGRTMVIVMPMPESLTNSGKGRSRHYRRVAKAKRAYWESVDLFVELGRIPPAPSPAFGVVRITSVMYLGARMDADNAMARHKWPIDWLQKNGYLVNDRFAEWMGQPTQIVKRGQGYRIELTLTEP